MAGRGTDILLGGNAEFLAKEELEKHGITPDNEKYEELKNKLLKLSQDQILIFAIGPAGKVLAYECFKNGYRVLDLGHVIKDYDTYKKNNLMDEKEIIKFFSPD